MTVRFFHTSDWHLGQFFYNHSRQYEHEQFLTWLIDQIKLKQPKPLITEIPDRHGHSKIGEAIDGYVSEAIGVKL